MFAKIIALNIILLGGIFSVLPTLMKQNFHAPCRFPVMAKCVLLPTWQLSP